LKQQSIKSLQEQAKKVKLEKFAIVKFSRGDYGYNSVESLFDNEVEVHLQIPYMKDDDKNAEQYIENIFKNAEQIIELLLIPITKHKLKKFDEASLLLYSQVEYQVENHTINILIPKAVTYKEAYRPPSFFSMEDYLKVMKNTLKIHLLNLEIIMNTRKFVFEKFEEAEGRGMVSFYKITGSAYGVSNSFTIKQEDFVKINMAKTMKAELKNFKKLSKQPSKPITDTIDLRSYPELVDAYKMSEKLTNASYASEGKSNWKEKHEKWENHDNNIFARAIFDTLSELNPNLIYWRTGEARSFKEVFGENFDKLDKNDRSCLLLLMIGSGPEIFADDVIFLDGKSNSQISKELLELGQNPENNISGAYMNIRDNGIILNDKNEIVYGPNYAAAEEHKANCYKMTVKYIKQNEHRLTHNYKIFKTPQNQYKASSLIAIFAAFNGNKEKAKEYKAKAEKIKNVERDDKLEKLLSAIV